MDFRAALAVLQQRSESGAPTGGGGSTGGLWCAECAETDDALPPPPPPPLSSDLALLSSAALVRHFFQRQEERVAAFHRFEDGFRRFLQVAEADGYQDLVRHATETFATISSGVNAIEAELRQRSAACAACAEAIRVVQTLERERLQLTAQLQIVRHGIALDNLRAESAQVAEEEVEGASTRAAAMRTSESSELSTRLTEVTTQLNEALDELRCELCELDAESDDGGGAQEAP